LVLAMLMVAGTVATIGVQTQWSLGAAADSFEIVGRANAAATPVSPLAKLAGPIQAAISSSDGQASVVVVDLSEARGNRLEINAHAVYDAASTYKLPTLMAEAERIASGASRATDKVCFDQSEQEDGWFDDYDDGDCYSRQSLGQRVGIYSDNTAGHMLVDDLGGARSLNTYAASRGARESKFFVPNQTTAYDLAALWEAEARGKAGGRAAQAWLYPLLTNTKFEKGIPAGVPDAVTVVHKVGFVDSTVNDAGVVLGPKRSYVLSVTTDGVGGDAAWALIARISALVWAAEAG
jgi:beta-lactamase class A